MKVTLPKDYKDIYTMTEIEAMRTTIKWFKDYEDNPADILRRAAKKWCEWNDETGFYGDPITVSVASVETVKTYNIPCDGICDGSRYTDVVVFGFVNYWKGTLRVFVSMYDVWGYEGANATVVVAKYHEI